MAVAYNKEEGILRDNRLNNFKNNINIDRFNLLTNITMDLTPTTRFDINMNSIFENYRPGRQYHRHIQERDELHR